MNPEVIRFQCSDCDQPLAVDAQTSGSRVTCPSCQRELIVPFPAPTSSAAPAESSESLCAICQSSLAEGEPVETCDACAARYHQECWSENGGCAVYGCSRVPQVEQRQSLEIPVSFWGQENKPCPSCGVQILAAAVRCRNCGATFASARPEDAGTYQHRRDRDERLPAMKRNVVLLFVSCVLPCLAPLGAVGGSIWYFLNRKSVQAMPSVYPTLCKIGLAVAIGQCILVGLMAALYAVSRNF